MSAYEKMPDPFFIRLDVKAGEKPRLDLPCAGYDGSDWRAKGFVNHLISWLPDYALDNEQLKQFSHASAWEQFREAAIRIYTTKYSEMRGEIGEICLHAICRRHFNTFPLVPRVFYLSSSNEVVKGFDLVHYRLPENEKIELWLGESKFYKDRKAAIAAAIHSVKLHLSHGFLKNDKLIIGPQIPSSTPRYAEIRGLFKDNTPIDQLKAKAVFPIGIFAESEAVSGNTSHTEAYLKSVALELEELATAVTSSGLADDVSIVLIYVPLRTKAEIINSFDMKLKAIQDG
jgi:hypothetical protein